MRGCITESSRTKQRTNGFIQRRNRDSMVAEYFIVSFFASNLPCFFLIIAVQQRSDESSLSLVQRRMRREPPLKFERFLSSPIVLRARLNNPAEKSREIFFRDDASHKKAAEFRKFTCVHVREIARPGCAANAITNSHE